MITQPTTVSKNLPGSNFFDPFHASVPFLYKKRQKKRVLDQRVGIIYLERTQNFPKNEHF